LVGGCIKKSFFIGNQGFDPSFSLLLRLVPETNSIEEFFSELKNYIKKESPNTYEEIDKVIKYILANKITKEHLTNYLKHSYKIYKS
jgi:hypothetical protein